MSVVQLHSEAPLAGIAHLVERRLAKAEVAGSSPVSRSIYFSPNGGEINGPKSGFLRHLVAVRGSKPVAEGNFDRPVNGQKGFERAAGSAPWTTPIALYRR